MAAIPSPLRQRVRTALSERLSPERTRQATLVERLTVERLRWETLVRLNRYLELGGKLATAIWVAFLVSVVFGVDWKDAVEHAVNSGKPLKSFVIVVIVLPTLVFVAARSLIGFARWRVQRELWRRDVRSVSPPDG